MVTEQSFLALISLQIDRNSIEEEQKWMNPMEHLYEYVYSYFTSLTRQVEQGIHEKIR